MSNEKDAWEALRQPTDVILALLANTMNRKGPENPETATALHPIVAAARDRFRGHPTPANAHAILLLAAAILPWSMVVLARPSSEFQRLARDLMSAVQQVQAAVPKDPV